MPPKRKRAQNSAAEAAPTRNTRSSARLAKQTDIQSAENEPIATTSKRSLEQETIIGNTIEDAPPAKKTKVAKTATRSESTKGKASKASNHKSKASQQVTISPQAADEQQSEPPKSSVKNVSNSSKPQIPKKLSFETYADPDNSLVIGPEGFERLCNDGNLPLEGAMPMILAWQLNSKEMAKISHDEWQIGMANLQITSLPALTVALDDLNDLLILGMPPPTLSATTKKKGAGVPAKDPYNRARYWAYTGDIHKSFSELYAFCFKLAKPEGSRNIDMETATALWSVLLVPRYPLIAETIDFINENRTYKGVNKDLWNMMLEFSRTVSPNLDNYEADGAWPTLLDDFVAWKKGKSLRTWPAED